MNLSVTPDVIIMQKEKESFFIVKCVIMIGLY